jgi:radical SAM protein with 4Fe4S-binding SPASM domain
VREASLAATEAAGLDRPYVISWNLTYRCNLACEHCYLDAGRPALTDREGFSDRSELGTEDCLAIVDEIARFAPECLVILTGGEPLLRRDLLEIVRHAHARGLWVVVGTNGVKITENLAEILREAGARGFALSLDALDAGRHDSFRRVRGAFENTIQGAKILRRAGFPFIVQTTVGRHNADELPALARFACEELGARVWNLYFLVPAGRGEFLSDLSPADYDRLLAELYSIQKQFAGRMLVNAKCAPHYVRTLFEREPASSFLKAYAGGAGGCPAGTHYLGIRPNGDVTPCPYLPVFGGNLAEQSLEEIWNRSEVFRKIRRRAELGGRCGACELRPACGGCRARAYGMTGDLLAEDPLCTHVPGTYAEAARRLEPALVYGEQAEEGLPWEPDARHRLARVPAFVRGMVVRSVEAYCRERGIERVTGEVLSEVRSRMPTPKLFGDRTPF